MIKKRILDRLAGFSLIELLIAMTILSIGITSAVTIFSNVYAYSLFDRDFQSGLDASNNFFTRLYVAQDLRTELFSPTELSNLNRIQLPHLFPPEKITISPRVTILVNKKVMKRKPLLVHVALELLVYPDSKSKRKMRQYGFESTFSESYLRSIK